MTRSPWRTCARLWKYWDDLMRHLDILLALERRLKTDAPKTDEALEECIGKAREDVDHPGKEQTLVEMIALGGKANGAGGALGAAEAF